MTRRRKHSLIIAPSPSERARETRERELRELEKMMSSGNTYEKRGGKVKQRRHATD